VKLAQKLVIWVENLFFDAIYASSRRIYCLNSYIINSKFLQLRDNREAQRKVL
jgi:hypothetical protein